MPGSWPLVGRSEELRLVESLLGRRDSPAGVVLVGAAGVGKTRLARESLAAAARRGAVTRWASATASARELPLGAFAAMVTESGSDPALTIRRAVDGLLAGVGRARLVVGVDDGHLLDELSASLVYQLALRRVATVVLTLRSGEQAPDAVTALWREGHLTRLEVEPLPAARVGELLESVLEGPVDEAAARRLSSSTRGNPLYLSHLVAGEREAGRLREVAGVWRWSGAPQLSPALTELVVSRIGALSQAQRDVVDMLAFGEPLGVAMLVALTDGAAVEQAQDQGLIEVTSDGRRLEARLGHPMYGEVRRAGCGQLRARRLRGRIAAAIAAAGGRRTDDTLRRAVLAAESDLTPDADLLTAAARRAVELTDLTLAERLARAALTAGGGIRPRIMLSYVLGWTGRGAEAQGELGSLAGLARTDAERAQAAVAAAGNLFFPSARPAEAEDALARAKATVSGTPALELAAFGSVMDAFLGRAERAAGAASEVVTDPRSTPEAVIQAVWALVTAGGSLGRIDGLDHLVARIDAMPGSLYLGTVRIGAVGALWMRALCLAGALDRAEEVAHRYRELVAGGSDPVRSMILTGCGEVARDRGKVSTSIRWLREAAPGALAPGWSLYVQLCLVPALGMAGDAAGARAALAAAQAAWHPSFVFLTPGLLLARAWVAAVEGVLSEAIDLACKAADVAAAQAQPAVEVVALHTAVSFGDRAVAPRLAALALRVEGARGRAAAEHAAALAANDGDALIASSQQLEQLGALLLAADAAAQAASVHTLHGRRGPAQSAAARARRLAESCEGANTPALRALQRRLPLTDREHEVVALAAAGASNQEIAERLAISVRTVEGHLYRAYTKLGLSDRTELSTLFPAPGAGRRPHGLTAPGSRSDII